MKTQKSTLALMTAMVLTVLIIVSSSSSHSQDVKKKKKEKQEKERMEVRITKSDTTINGKKWAELSDAEKEKFHKMQKELDIEMDQLHKESKELEKEMKRIQIEIEDIDLNDGNGEKISIERDGKRIIINGKEINTEDFPEIPEMPELERIEGITAPPHPPGHPRKMIYRFHDGNIETEGVNGGDIQCFVFRDGDKNLTIKILKPGKADLELLKGTNKPSAASESSSVNLYPNPTSGEFKISVDLKDKSPVTVTVSDINGKELSKEIIKDFKGGTFERSFVLNEYQNGTYFVSITQGQEVITRKMIIQK